MVQQESEGTARIEEKLRGRKPCLLDYDRYQRSAVLLSLVRWEGQLCLLFEVRALHMRRQPGEICFPGGRINPEDPSEADAAVRETCEELGLSPLDIRLLGPLDRVVTPSSSIVYPFVGEIADASLIHPQAEEVAEVFYVPLSQLLAQEPISHPVHVRSFPPDDFPYSLVPGGRNYAWRSSQVTHYFYRYEGRVIWGLTARILHHFLELVR